MRTDKDLALKLRLRGKSFGEIKKTLKISKSTLSLWFRSNQKSQEITKFLRSKQNPAIANNIALMNERNRVKWQKWRQSAREEAYGQFPQLSKNPLFCTGVAMYWAEGDSKPGNPLRFTNTDPRMVSLYVKFLKLLLVPIENVRITLILYPDLDVTKCMKFWSSITGITHSQFYKTQFIKGRHPTARLEKGICLVIVNSRWIKEKFLIWIDLLSKTL